MPNAYHMYSKSYKHVSRAQENFTTGNEANEGGRRQCLKDI